MLTEVDTKGILLMEYLRVPELLFSLIKFDMKATLWVESLREKEF